MNCITVRAKPHCASPSIHWREISLWKTENVPCWVQKYSPESCLSRLYEMNIPLFFYEKSFLASKWTIPCKQNDSYGRITTKFLPTYEKHVHLTTINITSNLLTLTAHRLRLIAIYTKLRLSFPTIRRREGKRWAARQRHDKTRQTVSETEDSPRLSEDSKRECNKTTQPSYFA